MVLYEKTDDYVVSLEKDATCRIKRSRFRGIFDYVIYRLFEKPKAIGVSEKGIDLSSTLLEVNEEKGRIEISGGTNAFLVGFLN
jgi:hypothetical protein